jgi:hypothetical protein
LCVRADAPFREFHASNPWSPFRCTNPEQRAKLTAVLGGKRSFGDAGPMADLHCCLVAGAASLVALRDRMVKIGAKIVPHGRTITFQMGEVMVPRGLFRQILNAIAAVRPLPPARC